MIDFLEGCLVSADGQSVCLAIDGVGWRILIPSGSRQQLPAAGSRVRLYTRLVMRENSMELYGFLRESQREVFTLLIGVSGVGGKVALSLLSAFSEDEICRLIQGEAVDILCQAAGVGVKTARRLVLELKDKVPQSLDAGSKEAPAYAEALDGLLALGYRPQEVAGILKDVARESGPQVGAGELVRQVLQKISQRG